MHTMQVMQVSRKIAGVASDINKCWWCRLCIDASRQKR